MQYRRAGSRVPRDDHEVSRLLNEYKVEVDLTQPKVAYRETIKKNSDVEYKYKKQSGGHGQYGDVWIRFEPNEPGKGFEFFNEVVGGSVPKEYIKPTQEGLEQALPNGLIAGYPVIDIKATLFDGSYHPVDSSEQAFKMAAHIAYKNGLSQASPCLLEPIELMKFTVPDDNTGDIMGIVNKRRGAVLGMNPVGDGLTEVDAELPMAETGDLATVIRQMTKGMGWFTMEFARYEQLPANLEAEVIANAPKYSEVEG